MKGNKVPRTDEEVQAAIERDYQGTNRDAIWGIYRSLRAMGDNVDNAWINTLMRVVEASKRGRE